MRLERIRAQQEKDKQVAEALAKFAAMQTELRNDRGKTKSTGEKPVAVVPKKSSQIVPVKLQGRANP